MTGEDAPPTVAVVTGAGRGGRAVLRSHPRSRAALLRGAAVWPASALAMLPYLRGIGERRRRRAREPGR